MKTLQINNASLNSVPVFKAKVSETLTETVKKYYTETGDINGQRAFSKKVNQFQLWGNDRIRIVYEKINLPDGKKSYCLFAKKGDAIEANCVTLAATSCLRELLEKFRHIDKHEFDRKIKNI